MKKLYFLLSTLFICFAVYSQNIQGIILDENKKAIPNVHISHRGKLLAISKDNGEFVFQLTETSKEDSLHFSSIAHIEKQVPLKAFTNNKNTRVYLETKSYLIEEVSKSELEHLKLFGIESQADFHYFDYVYRAENYILNQEYHKALNTYDSLQLKAYRMRSCDLLNAILCAKYTRQEDKFSQFLYQLPGVGYSLSQIKEVCFQDSLYFSHYKHLEKNYESLHHSYEKEKSSEFILKHNYLFANDQRFAKMLVFNQIQPHICDSIYTANIYRFMKLFQDYKIPKGKHFYLKSSTYASPFDFIFLRHIYGFINRYKAGYFSSYKSYKQYEQSIKILELKLDTFCKSLIKEGLFSPASFRFCKEYSSYALVYKNLNIHFYHLYTGELKANKKDSDVHTCLALISGIKKEQIPDLDSCRKELYLPNTETAVNRAYFTLHQSAFSLSSEAQSKITYINKKKTEVEKFKAFLSKKGFVLDLAFKNNSDQEN